MFHKITFLFQNRTGGGINSRLLKNNYQKTSKAIAFLFCVIFFVFLPVGFSGFSRAEAATYFVDGASGDDTTGTGAQAQPWKTLIKAETAAANGDTVNIKSGTYIEASSVGGSSGNITFTKAIAWIGKGSDWVGDGMVILQGKTSTSDIIVAGNTNIASFTNFTFDAQNARSRDITVNTGHTNKTFTNCIFENGVGGGYLLNIGDGGVVTFNSCSFSYSGGSGSYVLYMGNAGVTLNDSVINSNVGAIRSGSTINAITLNNTDINETNPTGRVIYQGSAGANLSITGGSINVTGGSDSDIIRWAGNITIDGATINTNTVNGQLLYNVGSTSSTMIKNADITHNMSGSTGNGFLSDGASFTIQDSAVSINGAYIALNLTSQVNLFLSRNTINFLASNNLSYFLYGNGTGSVNINNNDIAIPSGTGTISTVFYKIPSSRVQVGDFIFNNNNLTIDTVFSKVIRVERSNCILAISGNTIDSTSTAINGGTVIYLADVPDPVITDNTITTQSTNTAEHINVAPSDVTHWLGTGVATISGNTSYTKSHSGHVIILGTDGSGGIAYDQKWNGSIIENNTIYGPAYFSDNNQYTTHDILIGENIKCFVRYNKIIGGSLGIVIKGDLGMDWQHQGGVYDNVIINPTYGAILSKGAENLDINNNTVYIGSVYSPSYAVSIGENLSNFPTTGNHFYNNIVYAKSAGRLINVDTYSTTNFQSYNNVYWNELGDLTQQVFSFNNIVHTGFNAWNIAIGGTDNSLLADPKFNNIGSNDATLQYPSSAIDAGASVSFTTDYLGNHIYGTPDIGAYEYQPPYTIGIDNPNISSPIRIYADGKYRYTNTISGSNIAKLNITPQAGFGIGDYNQWMDVSIDTWHTSADYYKKWTESSDNHSMVTSHIIGDLKPNTYYTLKIDTNNQDTYLSSSSGQITFTYSGGYSTKTFEIEERPSGVFISPPKPIVTPTDPTLGTVPSNITQIAISRTPDFTNTSWQTFDKDKFKNIDQTTETLYVKFRTDQGAVSDVIIYTPKAANQTIPIPLIEGDIVKAPNNPDVYVIKYKNNKQYKRLILSPLVFKSYQHLKWENIKIVSQEQLDQFTTSNLVKETIDTIIYQLFPNGDTGERKAQDTSINYDSDSVYEINGVDRDSYKLVK